MNILVDDEHNACVADFGLSRMLGESGFTTNTVSGTYRWMACELIAYELRGEIVPRVTAASDVWAFGLTVLEVESFLPYPASYSNAYSTPTQILTGRLPFWQLRAALSVSHFVTKGGRPTHEVYPKISNYHWLMLEKCWHTDPAQRPSMQSLALSLG
jgi:serine/threonine protein kinase